MTSSLATATMGTDATIVATGFAMVVPFVGHAGGDTGEAHQRKR